ncbi:ULP1B [Symbiodinium sp. CCMP2456]|nr:ULP1B [Symbiodinium sp. CCMP2456]
MLPRPYACRPRACVLLACCGVAFGDTAALERCSFEVVMVDDRPWKRLAAPQAPYWVLGAALNYAYAMHFSYRIRLVRPYHWTDPYKGMQGSYPGWNKVLYFSELLRESQQRCTWLLYLDCDAFVRAFVPFTSLLSDLARRYGLNTGNCEGTSAIFAREDPMPFLNLSSGPMPTGAVPAAPFINTGVFFVRADCLSSRQLFETWLSAAANLPRRRLWTTWPGEQGVLSQLLAPGSYPEASSGISLPFKSSAVAVVNMTEINSPWGHYIHHAWGTEATDHVLRRRAMVDSLLRLGAADPHVFGQLSRGILRHVTRWPRPVPQKAVRYRSEV